MVKYVLITKSFFLHTHPEWHKLTHCLSPKTFCSLPVDLHFHWSLPPSVSCSLPLSLSVRLPGLLFMLQSGLPRNYRCPSAHLLSLSQQRLFGRGLSHVDVCLWMCVCVPSWLRFFNLFNHYLDLSHKKKSSGDANYELKERRWREDRIGRIMHSGGCQLQSYWDKYTFSGMGKKGVGCVDWELGGVTGTFSPNPTACCYKPQWGSARHRPQSLVSTASSLYHSLPKVFTVLYALSQCQPPIHSFTIAAQPHASPALSSLWVK